MGSISLELCNAVMKLLAFPHIARVGLRRRPKKKLESYNKGLITELMGRIRIEKNGYQLDAFTASER